MTKQIPINVPFPKSIKARCEVRLATVRGGWAMGLDVGLDGVWGHSFAPLPKWGVYPDRKTALYVGLTKAAEHFQKSLAYHASEKNTCRRNTSAAAAVRTFIAQQFPVPPTTKEPVMPAVRKSREPRAQTPTPKGHGFGRQVRRTLEAQQLAESKGRLPPGLTSTTTPAGIATHDPDATFNEQRAKEFAAEHAPTKTAVADESPQWQESPSGQIAAIDIENLVRHPDNRVPDESEILGKMASFREVGQLEPIVVWQPAMVLINGAEWPDPNAKLQILSGETRWLAARRLGWQTIQARLITDITAGQALEYLARYNGERKDLDPIQRARLIERLRAPVAEGGAGLTLAQAAERVGLERDASASNLVRLLKLPKIWQQRVASGELPESWARLITPYVDVPAVMKELESDWATRETDAYDNAFCSRAGLEEALPNVVAQVCRRLDQVLWDGKNYTPPKIDVHDPAVSKKLGLIELQLPAGKKGQTAAVLVATNADAFDELVKKEHVRTSKAGAEKAGSDDGEKPELTPAEKKERAEQRSKQLLDRVRAWRHKLLRREITKRIEQGKDNGLRIVLGFACQPPYRGPGFEMCLRGRGALLNYIDTWSYVSGFRKERQDEVLADVALYMLALESDDHRQPVFAFNFIEKYACDLGIDVEQAWLSLQDGKADGEAMQLLEEFFLLHQSPEAVELAAQLKVHLPPSVKSKAQIVKLLLSAPQGTKRLPLPKSIQPIAGAKKPAKAKPKTKKKATTYLTNQGDK